MKARIQIQRSQSEANDAMDVVYVGEMFEEDDFVCVAYDEVVGFDESGDEEQMVHYKVRVKDNEAEIIKTGESESHMLFVPNKTTHTLYKTPYGNLEFGIFTDHFERNIHENGFSLALQYQLEMNQLYVDTNIVNISVDY